MGEGRERDLRRCTLGLLIIVADTNFSDNGDLTIFRSSARTGYMYIALLLRQGGRRGDGEGKEGMYLYA